MKTNNILKNTVFTISTLTSVNALAVDTNESCKKILEWEIHDTQFYDRFLDCYWEVNDWSIAWLNRFKQSSSEWIKLGWSSYVNHKDKEEVTNDDSWKIEGNLFNLYWEDTSWEVLGLLNMYQLRK